MSLSAGDAPQILQGKSLLDAVILNAAANFEEDYPATAAFLANGGGFSKVEYEKLRVVQRREVRRIAELHGAPGDGDQLPVAQLGEIAADVLYLQLSGSLAANHANLLRNAMRPNASRSERAMLAQMEIIEGLVRAIRRSLEQLCAGLLYSDTSYSATVDGATVTFTTNVESYDAAASWYLASTDIPGDLSRMMRLHRKKCGRNPDSIWYADELVDEIATNDSIRELCANNNRSTFIDSLPLGLMSRVAAGRMREVIYTSNRGYDAADNEVIFWPKSRLVLASFDRPRAVQMLGVDTYEDNQADGFYSRSWMDNSSGSMMFKVGTNGVPVVMNPECITTFDVDP